MGGNIIGGLGESLRGSEGMVEVARSHNWVRSEGNPIGPGMASPAGWNGAPSSSPGSPIRMALYPMGVSPNLPDAAPGELVSFRRCLAGARLSAFTGEVIFFDWDGDGVPDHVGIVESSDGSTVYTIEGNWADSVHTDAYPINSSQIYGYATPNYFD